jgi:hypothetical protein
MELTARLIFKYCDSKQRTVEQWLLVWGTNIWLHFARDIDTHLFPLFALYFSSPLNNKQLLM